MNNIDNFGKKPQNNNIEYKNLPKNPYKVIDFSEDNENNFSKSENLSNIFLKKFSPENENIKNSPIPINPINKNPWLNNLIKLSDNSYKEKLKSEIFFYLKKEEQVKKI